MRRSPRVQRDDHGATAILVGLLATVLIGLAGFTADLGMAYANKRQLQTAADAAALGAAGVLASSQRFACGDVLTDAGSAANSQASGKVSANAPAGGTATLSGYSATCTTDSLQVTATVSGTSPNFFGKVLGRSSAYDVSRTATAVVEGATGVGTRLKPIAVCASDLPGTVTSGSPFELHLPGNGLAPPATCPVPPNAGNWWTLDCPGESNDDADEARGTSALEDQIRNGCSLPVTIVPGQGTATGTALNNILSSACPAPSSSAPYACLGGDPGQPDAGHIEDAWKDVIDAGETVFIPVFCAPSPGLCATSSVSGNGTGAVFPVHKFVGVSVCGYHFGKQPSRQYKPTSIGAQCAAAAPNLAAMSSDDSDDAYLVMVFRNAQVSGSTMPSTCKVGDPICDTGVRQVRLID